MEIHEAVIEQVAMVCREAYADYIGDKEIVPWNKAKSAPSWRVIAKAALEEIYEINSVE